MRNIFELTTFKFHHLVENFSLFFIVANLEKNTQESFYTNAACRTLKSKNLGLKKYLDNVECEVVKDPANARVVSIFPFWEECREKVSKS